MKEIPVYFGFDASGYLVDEIASVTSFQFSACEVHIHGELFVRDVSFNEVETQISYRLGSSPKGESDEHVSLTSPHAHSRRIIVTVDATEEALEKAARTSVNSRVKFGGYVARVSTYEGKVYYYIYDRAIIGRILV